MSYSQDFGTSAMKHFVHNRQRKLAMDIEDAKEWSAARSNATFEAVDDDVADTDTDTGTNRHTDRVAHGDANKDAKK